MVRYGGGRLTGGEGRGPLSHAGAPAYPLSSAHPHSGPFLLGGHWPSGVSASPVCCFVTPEQDALWWTMLRLLWWKEGPIHEC